MPIVSIVAGVGASSPSGGGGGRAPNVTATATPFYDIQGSVSVFGFQGTITLPTTDPNYSYLKKISVNAFTGTAEQGAELANFTYPFADTTLPYKSDTFSQPDTEQTWSIEFICYDETGEATINPFTIADLTVSTSAITVVSGVDASTLATSNPNYHARWQDPALHVVVNATVCCNQYPKTVTLWTTSTQYGRIWHGWFNVPAPDTVIPIGLQNSNTSLFAPDLDEMWTLTCAPGQVMAQDDPPAEALTSSAFSTAAAATPGAREATGAYIDEITYAPTGGGAYDFGWSHLYVTLPLTDPEFWFARLTLQTGSLVGSVFTPGGCHPTETNMCDWATDDDHGDNLTHVAGTNRIYDHNPNQWGVPSDANTCHRFRWYITSRRGGPMGTTTLQQCWSSGVGISTPGTADHYDVIVDSTKALLDATKINPTTLSPTFVIGGGILNIAPGNGLAFDVNGKITVKTAASLGFDQNGAVTVPIGSGIAYDGTGKITVKTAAGLGFDSNGAVTVPIGSGIAFDSNGKVIVKTASGLGFNGSGALVLAYGAGLADDGSGNATIKVSGPIYKDVSGNLNFSSSSDFVVSGGVLAQNAVNLAKAYGFNTTNFSTSSGNLAINQIAVNSLIAGNALFTGTTIFAVNNGGQVTINSSGLTLANSIYLPTSTVTIAYSGVTIANGSNSVQATSSGIGVYGPSGSLTATSGGVVISNGSSSVATTWSGVSMAYGSNSTQINYNGVYIYGPSGSLTATSAGVVISNGSSSLTTTASSVAIANGSNSTQVNSNGVYITGPAGTLTATNAGVVIANGSSSVTTTASSVSIAYGTTSTQVNANGFYIYGPSGTLTATNAGIVIANQSSSVSITSSAVTIANGVLNSGTINGGSLTITTASGQVTINNTSYGVHVDQINSQCSGFSTSLWGTYSTQVFPFSIWVNTPSGNATYNGGGCGFVVPTNTNINSSFGIYQLSINYPGQGSMLSYNTLSFSVNGSYPVQLSPLTGLMINNATVIGTDGVFCGKMTDIIQPNQNNIVNAGAYGGVRRYGTADPYDYTGWYFKIQLLGGPAPKDVLIPMYVHN